MRVTALVTVCVLSIAGPVYGQSQLTFGYDWARVDNSESEPINLPIGFVVAYSHPIRSSVSAVAQLQWARKADSGSVADDAGQSYFAETRFSQLAIGAGLRWNGTGTGTVAPYAQIIGGVARAALRIAFNGNRAVDAVSTDILVAPGAGLMVKVTDRLGIVGQLDYDWAFPATDSEVYFGAAVHAVQGMAGVRISWR